MGKTKSFDIEVVTNSKFTNMPAGAQALYFQMIADADSKGNVEEPLLLAQKSFYTASADLETLVASGYIRVNSDKTKAVVAHWPKSAAEKTTAYYGKQAAIRKLFEEEQADRWAGGKMFWQHGKNKNVYLDTMQFFEFQQEHPRNHNELIESYSEAKIKYDGKDNTNDYKRLKKYADIMELVE